MGVANISGNILTDSGTNLSSLVSGSGTTNYLPKFTGASTIGNSIISDNGTTASILGKLSITNTYANDPLVSLATTTSGNVEVQMRTATTTYNAGIGVVTSGYDFSLFTNNTPRLTIASTGAATFSSSVTAGSYMLINGVTGGTSTYLQFNNNGTGIGYVGSAAAINGGAANSIALGVASGAGLTIASTGAATFSSTVSATQYTATSTGGSGLRVYGGSGTNQWDMYLNGANLRFSDNTGTGSFVVDRPATFSSTIQSSGLTLLGSTGAGTGPSLYWDRTGGYGGFNATYKYENTYYTGGSTLEFQAGNGITMFRMASNNAYSAGQIHLMPSGGNVGIGTSSPSGRLMVYGSSAGNVFQNIVSNQGGSTQVGINLSPSMTDAEVAANPAQASIYATDSNYGANIIFANKTTGAVGNSLTERMTITSGGNVLLTQDATIYNSTGNLFMRAGTSGDLILGSGGSNDRMRITSGGQISQTAPLADWSYVMTNSNASSPNGIIIQYTGANKNNSSNPFIYCTDNFGASLRFVVYSNGNVQNQNNSYGAISDAKLKENVTDASPKLDDLLKVKIRNYNLIGDETKQIGVIAQELEEVFPSMIDESEDFAEVEVEGEDGIITKERQSLGTTTKSVKYSVFVPILIKAIQELEARIKQLENK